MPWRQPQGNMATADAYLPGAVGPCFLRPSASPDRGPSAPTARPGGSHPWERLHVWDEVKKEQEVLVFEHALNTIAQTKKPAEPDRRWLTLNQVLSPPGAWSYQIDAAHDCRQLLSILLTVCYGPNPEIEWFAGLSDEPRTH